MQLKRGTAPQTIQREVDVELTKEEVLQILGTYAKRKFNNDKLMFDELHIAAENINNEFTLSSVTLMGVETLPIVWPADGESGPVKVTAAPATPSSPAVVPVNTGIPATASNLPPALQQIKADAAKQAYQQVSDAKKALPLS